MMAVGIIRDPRVYISSRDHRQASIHGPKRGPGAGSSSVDPEGPPATLPAHLDEAGIGDQLLGVHHIHQGLLDGHVFDARHVEAIHVLPPWGGGGEEGSAHG